MSMPTSGPLIRMFLIALVIAGCDDEPTLVILQNQKTGVGPSGLCEVPTDGAGAFRGLGVLDVALDKPYPYILYPLVVNAAGDPIAITGARVKVIPPAVMGHVWDAACPLTFEWPFSTTLESEHERVMIVQAVPACLTAQLTALLESDVLSAGLEEHVFARVEVRVTGVLAGQKVESEAFSYPIRVCMGCLQTGVPRPYVDFPGTYDCDAFTSAVGMNAYRGNPCGLAQDVGPVICCLQPSGGLVCPAP